MPAKSVYLGRTSRGLGLNLEEMFFLSRLEILLRVEDPGSTTLFRSLRVTWVPGFWTTSDPKFGKESATLKVL